jgi:hypothetical protein
MSEEPPVQRVRVTGPRAGQPRRMTAASQIDARTEVGEIYMRALMRSQLRLALLVAGVLALTVGLLPLAFWLFPGVSDVHLAGIPLPWVLLGGAVYPVLIGLSRFYVRHAERNEASFHDLIKPR